MSGSADAYAASEDQFQLAEEATYGTAGTTFSVMPGIGSGSVKVARKAAQDAGPTIGNATFERKKREFYQGRSETEFTLPDTYADDARLAWIWHSFFQHGCTSSAITGGKKYACVIPAGTQPSTFKGLTARRVMGGGDANASHQLKGAIIGNWELASETGGFVTLKAGGLGLAGDPVTGAASSTVITGTTQLLHDALTLTIDGSAVKPLAFRVSGKNSLARHYDQSLDPTSLLIAASKEKYQIEFEVTLSLKSFGITQFTKLDTNAIGELVALWGTDGVLGGVKMDFDFLYQGDPVPAPRNDVQAIVLKGILAQDTHTSAFNVSSAANLTLAT